VCRLSGLVIGLSLGSCAAARARDAARRAPVLDDFGHAAQRERRARRLRQ
jgi:hypothetical protein